MNGKHAMQRSVVFQGHLARNCWRGFRGQESKTLHVQTQDRPCRAKIPHSKCMAEGRFPAYLWGRAKEAAKASCRETVVQNGVFGESVSSLPT